jgi:SnoaL-like domain
LGSTRIAKSFELLAEGQFDALRPWLTDDFRYHVPEIGILYSGRDEALEALRQLYVDFEANWTSYRIEEHGKFVVSFNTGTTNIGPDPIESVLVFRFEGDLIAECWVLVPPMM